MNTRTVAITAIVLFFSVFLLVGAGCGRETLSNNSFPSKQAGKENDFETMNNQNAPAIGSQQSNTEQSNIDNPKRNAPDEKSKATTGEPSSYLQYPKHWFVYDYSNETEQQVFYSDGGRFAREGLTDKEILDKLSFRASDQYKGEVNDECLFVITAILTGTAIRYTTDHFNTKDDPMKRQNCEGIIAGFIQQAQDRGLISATNK